MILGSGCAGKQTKLGAEVKQRTKCERSKFAVVSRVKDGCSPAGVRSACLAGNCGYRCASALAIPSPLFAVSDQRMHGAHTCIA
jgi:hypothetical protein